MWGCVWLLTWSCGEGIEEVCFHWDLGGAFMVVSFNAWIQLSTPASLFHEHRNKTRSGYQIKRLMSALGVGKKNLLQYLDEKKFGLSHQWFTTISPKKRCQELKVYWAIRTKKHTFISMTQQNTHKRCWAAVIFLWHWKQRIIIFIFLDKIISKTASERNESFRARVFTSVYVGILSDFYECWIILTSS